MASYINKKEKGFTLIELLVVIAIVSLLSSIILTNLNKSRQNSYKSTADQAIAQMYLALQLYLNENNGVYPDDVGRNIPAEIKQYIGSNNVTDWPTAPWPGSVFDWDNWDISGENVIQISIRFCPAAGPLSECRFPNEPWANGFDINSAYYFCIKGSCRSHQSEPVNYPGYCVNC
jgi:prepilin-type N-terminal cleavage/methylation domain-containing protein